MDFEAVKKLNIDQKLPRCTAFSLWNVSTSSYPLCNLPESMENELCVTRPLNPFGHQTLGEQTPSSFNFKTVSRSSGHTWAWHPWCMKPYVTHQNSIFSFFLGNLCWKGTTLSSFLHAWSPYVPPLFSYRGPVYVAYIPQNLMATSHPDSNNNSQMVQTSTPTFLSCPQVDHLLSRVQIPFFFLWNTYASKATFGSPFLI